MGTMATEASEPDAYQLAPRKGEVMVEDLKRLFTEDGEGGSISIAYLPERREWAVGIVWGREAPDSDMAGAAAYGLGDTVEKAVEGALREVGI